MPSGAYHSSLNETGAAEVCGFPLVPIKRTHPALQTSTGPAPFVEGAAAGAGGGGEAAGAPEDAVDEALRLFRPNVLFKNFEVQGGGDRSLVYLLLFTQQCLRRLEKRGVAQTRADATKELLPLAQSAHFIPGDAGWPLGGVLAAPKSAAEAEQLRLLFRQLREALVPRLLDRVFSGPEGQASKHWLMFAKRKFMGKEFA